MNYRIILPSLLVLFAVNTSAQTALVNTMMPLPTHVTPATGDLELSPTATFRIEAAESTLLREATERMILRLQNETYIRFATPQITKDATATVTIKVADVTKTVPMLGDDESYHIDVANGSATLQAATLFGAYRAMETFLQMVQAHSGSYVIPAAHIEDSPRFPWRGLMLDTGRHFLPAAAVLRTIDGMAAVKLNVLHMHLSEDQGFRLESHRFPKLQEMGSNGLFYTQAQMHEIIAYAASRGIRVVPEFDMPGHSTSWMVGYPVLGSGPGPFHVERGFGIFDAAMDPTRESTYKFLDAFFGEMTQLFPDSYVHIGGDESNGKAWRNNPSIAAFMKAHNMADTKALQAYFNQRVQKILKKYHRTMIGWDEVLHPDLSPDVVIQNWHGATFLIDAARQGHKGLLSQPFYLDHHYSAGQMFQADPIPPNSGLTSEQTKLILGGEGCMWAEQIVDATVDSRIWPRMAAVAERFWSAQDDRNVDDMYRRLQVESLRLDALGLQNISGPQRGLRQIAGSETSPALEVLAAALQPVDFGERSKRQHNTQDTPMTGFVDAVRPDPPLRHDLARTVAEYLHGSTDAKDAARKALSDLFASWIATGPALNQLASSRPRVNGVIKRREQIVELGQLGLEMMKSCDAGQSLDPHARALGQQLLKQVAASNDELVDFAVLEPLHSLLNAAETKQSEMKP